MKFLIADAFTNTLFGGNPAGIVILPEGADFPSEETMVKTAAELRYSETAFVKTLGPKEFNVRYFTPAAEVDLCGHATIATFFSLMKLGIIAEGDECINHTLAGDISVSVKDGFVMMDMASPLLIDKIQGVLELDELYDIMGSEYDQSLPLLPQLISTGLPDIIMPVKTKRGLDSLKPDMEALSKLSEKYKVTGVHAFTLEGGNIQNPEGEISCFARNFAPLYDIDEEAATGTSNGALTYYLYINNLIEAPRELSIIQGEAMGRPSLIQAQITEDPATGAPGIKVGGKAVILAEGEINI